MKKSKKKEPKFKKANVVELGSRPIHGRILWVGVSLKEDGKTRTIHSGATHEGLIKSTRNNEFVDFNVLDLKKGILIQLSPEAIEPFLEKWKENYFNPKWGANSIQKMFS